MARARRKETPLVLAFIDVDRLKAVNDSRSHPAGDRMLLEVANALGAKVRSYDLILRPGGDGFVWALSGLNLPHVTERLLLVNTALAEGTEPGLVRFGLAELLPGDSPRDLVERASAALHRTTSPDAS